MPATATAAEGKRLPGARLVGRVADARHAHRETGRPDCGPDGRHLQTAASAAKSIRTARALEGRGRNPAREVASFIVVAVFSKVPASICQQTGTLRLLNIFGPSFLPPVCSTSLQVHNWRHL